MVTLPAQTLGRTSRKLALAAALIIAVNGLDLASTYAASPDLSAEWNVLTRHLGLGWAGLVGAKLVGGWLAFIGYAYYLRHRYACFPAPGGTDADFARGFLLGDGPAAGPQTQDDSVRRALVCAGYLWMGLQGLVLWVGLDNIGLAFGVVSPLRFGPETLYHYVQCGLVAAVVAVRYYTTNLRDYRSMPSLAVTRASEEKRPTSVSR